MNKVLARRLVIALSGIRWALREEKQFELADKIKLIIKDMGYSIKDKKESYIITHD